MLISCQNEQWYAFFLNVYYSRMNFVIGAFCVVYGVVTEFHMLFGTASLLNTLFCLCFTHNTGLMIMIQVFWDVMLLFGFDAVSLDLTLCRWMWHCNVGFDGLSSDVMLCRWIWRFVVGCDTVMLYSTLCRWMWHCNVGFDALSLDVTL